MATTIYRVCRRIYASLDGEGARRVGGRWNSPGRPVVYMAKSVALAVLENSVHMSRQDYPTGYVVVAATIPDHVRTIKHVRYLDSKSSDAASERTALVKALAQQGISGFTAMNPRSYEFLQPW
jgi:RES domain-containing protein